MRFSVATVVAALSLVAPALATYKSQPSSTAGHHWGCPDIDLKSMSKLDWLCDTPPHSSNLFGCTYRTGTGTGTYKCIYDTITGDCKSAETDCPKSAVKHTSKRSAEAEPAPATPGNHYGRRSSSYF